MGSGGSAPARTAARKRDQEYHGPLSVPVSLPGSRNPNNRVVRRRPVSIEQGHHVTSRFTSKTGGTSALAESIVAAAHMARCSAFAVWEGRKAQTRHNQSYVPMKSGDPDFHQLEPDGELATPTPRAPTSRIVKRGRRVRSTSIWLRPVSGAGEPVAEHCGVTQDRPPARRRRLSRISQPGAPWSD